MNQSDIISLYTSSGAHYHEVWELYVFVVGGVLAITFTDSFANLKTALPRLVLLLALVAFIVGNAWSLWMGAGVHNAIVNRMEGDVGEAIRVTLPYISRRAAMGVHGLIDVLLVLAVLQRCRWLGSSARA